MDKYNKEISSQKIILQSAQTALQNAQKADQESKKAKMIQKQVNQYQSHYNQQKYKQDRCCSRTQGYCCSREIVHPHRGSYHKIFRRLERRTRSLIRNIEHRKESRHLHDRTRRLLRRLSSRLREIISSL